MKRFLTIFSAITLSCMALQAQQSVSEIKSANDNATSVVKQEKSTSRMYRKGYRADIELSCGISEQWGISSSHGFSFGNGLYVGGGVGFMAEFVPDYNSKPVYLTPIFADLKYSFLDKVATPFVGFKVGKMIDITNSAARWFFSPEIGVDIHKFSILFGYEFQQAFIGYNSKHINQYLKVGVGFTF